MSDREIDFLFDSPKVISLCLNCSKRECDNCLGTNCSVKKVHVSKIDHDKFMEWYEEGLTDVEIGKRFNVNNTTIRDYRKKHNLPSKRPPNRFDEIKFIDLYEKGLTDGEIAKELGLTTSYICARRQKLGLPTKYVPKRRVKNAERIR